MKSAAPPPAQGLYDPRHEHDACGVGFVVDLKGRKSSSIVRNGLEILLNLEHRGASGCEKNTGDGAGILMQVPHRFLAEACAAIRIKLPAAGEYGVGVVFLPHDPGSRAACEHLFEKVVRDEGQTFLGWREVPIDNSMLGQTAKRSQPVIKQLFVGRGPDDHRRRRVRAQALRDPAAGAARRAAARRPREGDLLHPQPVGAHRRLQGDAQLRSAAAVLSRPARRPRRVGAGAGALPFLDQHLPELAARASLPAGRAQRRDQHAARQRQLDARAREHVQVEPVRRRPGQVHPGHRHRRQRLGDVRQRAGAA